PWPHCVVDESGNMRLDELLVERSEAGLNRHPVFTAERVSGTPAPQEFLDFRWELNLTHRYPLEDSPVALQGRSRTPQSGQVNANHGEPVNAWQGCARRSS